MWSLYGVGGCGHCMGWVGVVIAWVGVQSIFAVRVFSLFHGHMPSAAECLVFEIANSRWCENVGRQHKSNHIM